MNEQLCTCGSPLYGKLAPLTDDTRLDLKCLTKDTSREFILISLFSETNKDQNEGLPEK